MKLKKKLEQKRDKLICDRVKKLKIKATNAEKYTKFLLSGIEYKFQKVIKNNKSFYVLDFYIPKLKLCIEIDGNNHSANRQKQYDLERESFLYKKGIKTLRINNEQILSMSTQEFYKYLQSYLDKGEVYQKNIKRIEQFNNVKIFTKDELKLVEHSYQQ